MTNLNAGSLNGCFSSKKYVIQHVDISRQALEKIMSGEMNRWSTKKKPDEIRFYCKNFILSVPIDICSNDHAFFELDKCE